MRLQKQLIKLIPCLLLLGCSSADAQLSSDVHYEKSVTKIAFGSCHKPPRKVSSKTTSPAIFDAIIKKQPDVFIFLGDNIYGDTEDMALLERKWGQLEAIKGFRTLRDNTTMLATWDDHDFGVNDGGNTYPKRKESEKIFLDFFKDPVDSPRRQRPGIYGSYTFGKKGQRCQVLMLDTRYFRDPLPQVPKNKRKPGTIGWYTPSKDTSKTLLGDAQWKWLEEQLQVPADVRIIASSIQTLSFEKGMENWGNVPHEQQRLFDLLKKHNAQQTFAISGDVHFSELSKSDIGGYPFYDLTSSGMTHTSEKWAKAKNSFRVGKASFEKNAGMIEIDWTKKSLKLESFNENGKPLIQHLIPFKELTFKK